MKYINNWCLAVAAFSAVLLTALPAQADIYSCERYNDDASGFSSFAAYESWHPKTIILKSKEAEQKGSQLVFTETLIMGGTSGGAKVLRITKLLPNGKAIAGLGHVGGYMDSGKARYKCKNLSDKYWDSENNRPRNLKE